MRREERAPLGRTITSRCSEIPTSLLSPGSNQRPPSIGGTPSIQSSAIRRVASLFVSATGHYGSEIQWLSSSAVQQLSASVAQRFSGSATQRYSNSVIQWFSDSVVQWLSDSVFSDSIVQRFIYYGMETWCGPLLVHL